ncbi:MAG: glycosyl transferase, partial [Candidatus Saganbacteria bacterium]|nr:glycosyl transferase [Candidatus Saganbacteria bacterium]
MEYGYFDNKNKEYVITRPDTPLPWINYLGCEEYCGLMSNTAGGYSFHKDPLKRRLLRYRYNNIPSDLGGRYIYIKDNRSGDFWSASWQPVRKDLTKYKYECRHGLGYTKIASTYSGIKTETTYFVPLKENLEIWMINIKNTNKRKMDITVIPFVEFCLWDALSDMGSLEAPLAVKRGKGSGSTACGWAPVGSLFIPIKLKAGEEKTLIFVLGFAGKKEEARKSLRKFGSRQKVLKELEKLGSYWEENLNKFTVEGDDPLVGEMVNIWNQYQCRTTFNWSRSASYYEAGIGRGMGYRDSCQDTLGFVHQIPNKVKERIIDLASNQNEDGSACHQYSPLTKKGKEEGRSDDHLWLIYAVASYIKETGDVDFLDEDITYSSGITGTLYEHLDRAVEHTMEHLGSHHLPLIGYSDWNDCLNLDTGKNRAESVMVGEMLVAAAKEMATLAEIQDLKQDKKKFLHIAEKMAAKIPASAGDGAGSTRAFTADGKPLGSPVHPAGKRALAPPGWAGLAGRA